MNSERVSVAASDDEQRIAQMARELLALTPEEARECAEVIHDIGCTISRLQDMVDGMQSVLVQLIVYLSATQEAVPGDA